MISLEFIGNLGFDAKIRAINGKDYLAFPVGCATGYGERKGTQWIDVLYRNTKLEQYLTKGTKVFVRGNPSFSIYKDSVQVSVFADSIELLSSRSEQTAQQAQAAQRPKTTPIPPAGDPQDDDLPFD